MTYHTYDILDRPQWSEVDPGLLTAPPTGSVAPPASEAYGFDAADNLTYQSDFNTRARQLGYDAANRLTGQTDQPSCGGGDDDHARQRGGLGAQPGRRAGRDLQRL